MKFGFPYFTLIVTYRKNNHCVLLSFWFTATGQLRKSLMSFCHLCGLVHPLCHPPVPMKKVNAALEFVSWRGVAWILIFYNSRLHQFEPAQLGERWCHRETTGGAAAPGVRGVGSSPLPPGQGRASWGRSGGSDIAVWICVLAVWCWLLPFCFSVCKWCGPLYPEEPDAYLHPVSWLPLQHRCCFHPGIRSPGRWVSHLTGCSVRLLWWI